MFSQRATPISAMTLVIVLMLPAFGARSLEPLRSAVDPESRIAEMSQAQLEAALHAIDPEAKGNGGAVHFRIDGLELACISDTTHGRMRIISPVVPVSALTGEQIGAILNANFHSALDVRYATSEGILYAAFIHPLGPLTTRELESAIRQVSSLVRTFGTSYSSGELIYRDGGGEAL